MKLIQSKFKIKDDKMEPPDTCLGATISKIDNVHGEECWAMSSDQYCSALVANVEEKLYKKGLQLPSRCVTPFSNGYQPSEDFTSELKAEGLQRFQ